MECVERALTKSIIPDLRNELKSILLAEAKECVLKACCRKFYNWIKVWLPIFIITFAFISCYLDCSLRHRFPG